MELVDINRYCSVLEIFLKVLERLHSKNEVPDKENAWIQTSRLIRIDIQLIKGQLCFENESGKNVGLKLLHRAIARILYLFSIIDDDNYKKRRNDSLLIPFVSNICEIIPDYTIEDARAEIEENLEILNEKMKNVQKRYGGIDERSPGTKITGKPKKRNDLLSYADETFTKKYQERFIEEKVKFIEEQLQENKKQRDIIGKVFQCKLIAHFINLVINLSLPSNITSFNSQIALLFNLAIAIIEHHDIIPSIVDITQDVVATFQLVVDSPVLELPEQLECNRLQESILQNEVELADIKDQLKDGSIDLEEKQYLIASRDRLEEKLADDRYRKQQLDSRLQWKEPKEAGHRNATILIDTLKKIRQQLGT